MVGKTLNKLKDMPLDELELPVRPYNALRTLGVKTLGDIQNITDKQLMDLPNFGAVSLREVRLLKQMLTNPVVALAAVKKEEARVEYYKFIDSNKDTMSEYFRVNMDRKMAESWYNEVAAKEYKTVEESYGG